MISDPKKDPRGENSGKGGVLREKKKKKKKQQSRKVRGERGGKKEIQFRKPIQSPTKKHVWSENRIKPKTEIGGKTGGPRSED